VRHLGWQDYLEYLDTLKENALQQMMALNMNEQDKFIYLNARLLLLDQISHHFEIDLADDGKNSPENLDRLQHVDKTYGERRKGLLRRLLGR
jgi:hypothetical protein